MFENSVNTARYSVDLRPIKASLWVTMIGHRPPSVYPLSIFLTKFPKPYPSILYTASDQKPEVGTAWEESYCTADTVVQFGEKQFVPVCYCCY